MPLFVRIHLLKHVKCSENDAFFMTLGSEAMFGESHVANQRGESSTEKRTIGFNTADESFVSA